MANEAVVVNNGIKTKRFNCTDLGLITKGTLLTYSGDMLVSGAALTAFAGIAAIDKGSGDGSTSLSVHQDGDWDLYAGEPMLAGSYVILSGANIVKQATSTSFLSGAIIGKLWEDATAHEIVKVAVGSLI